MSVTELAEKVGITMANISILKNEKARQIRGGRTSRRSARMACGKSVRVLRINEQAQSKDEGDPS